MERIKTKNNYKTKVLNKYKSYIICFFVVLIVYIFTCSNVIQSFSGYYVLSNFFLRHKTNSEKIK